MMTTKEINASPVTKLRSNRIATFDAAIKNITLRTVTEIDFITCGIKPKSELFFRASEILLNSEKLEAKSYQRKNSLPEVVLRLVQSYVRQQEHLFKPSRVYTEDCAIKANVWKLMNCGNMPSSLRNALEFRGQIENSATDSEIYSIALGIIHEFETYCSQIVAIKKYVEAQRKIINSYRKVFLLLLERRDRLVYRGCGSVESLNIDHIKPLSLGGKSEIENLQILCRFCNSSKGNR